MTDTPTATTPPIPDRTLIDPRADVSKAFLGSNAHGVEIRSPLAPDTHAAYEWETDGESRLHITGDPDPLPEKDQADSVHTKEPSTLVL